MREAFDGLPVVPGYWEPRRQHLCVRCGVWIAPASRGRAAKWCDGCRSPRDQKKLVKLRARRAARRRA